MSKKNIPLQIPNKKVNYSPQYRNLIPGNGVEFNPVDDRVSEVDASIGGMVKTPVISVSNNLVSATCETEGAVIMYYIDDKSNPQFEIYSEPFLIGADVTLVFWAQKAGMINSLPAISSLEFGMEQPLFSLDKYTGTVSMENPNSENFPSSYIVYTTDGSTPTDQNGTRYTSPFVLSQATTVKAIVVYNNVTSSVTVKEYSIITLSYGIGNGYSTNKTICEVTPYINTAITTGVDIYQTTDGSTPDQFSTKSNTVETAVYGAQITAKFIGYKEDCIPSQVLTCVIGQTKPSTPTISYSSYRGSVSITPNTPYGYGQYFSVYYTTDGSTPTAQNGTLYNSPFTLSSACTIKAVVYYVPGEFYSDVAQMVTYSVTVGTSTGGSASANVNIVNAGSSVTLSATPDTGYTFSEWSDGNTDNPRTIFNVQNNISLSAVFEQNTPATTLVKIVPSGDGLYDETEEDIAYMIDNAVDVLINDDIVNTDDGWTYDSDGKCFYKNIDLGGLTTIRVSPSGWQAASGSNVYANPGYEDLGTLEWGAIVNVSVTSAIEEIIISLYLTYYE